MSTDGHISNSAVDITTLRFLSKFDINMIHTTVLIYHCKDLQWLTWAKQMKHVNRRMSMFPRADSTVQVNFIETFKTFQPTQFTWNNSVNYFNQSYREWREKGHLRHVFGEEPCSLISFTFLKHASILDWKACLRCFVYNFLMSVI